jgi:hypothetical protein
MQLDCYPIPIDLIMHKQVKHKDIFKIKDKEHWLMHRGVVALVSGFLSKKLRMLWARGCGERRAPTVELCGGAGRLRAPAVGGSI